LTHWERGISTNSLGSGASSPSSRSEIFASTALTEARGNAARSW
jgi:hypothetical protein